MFPIYVVKLIGTHTDTHIEKNIRANGKTKRGDNGG